MIGESGVTYQAPRDFSNVNRIVQNARKGSRNTLHGHLNKPRQTVIRDARLWILQTMAASHPANSNTSHTEEIIPHQHDPGHGAPVFPMWHFKKEKINGKTILQHWR